MLPQIVMFMELLEGLTRLRESLFFFREFDLLRKLLDLQQMLTMIFNPLSLKYKGEGDIMELLGNIE